MLLIPPTNLLPVAAKQEAREKAYQLTKTIEEFSKEKKVGKMGRPAGRRKNDKTERVTELVRR